MPLDAEELESQRFPIRVGGYNAEAVDRFIAEVAHDYRLARDAAAQLSRLLESALTGARDYLSTPETSNVLSTVEELAELFVGLAQKHAETIKREARASAASTEHQATQAAEATAEEAQRTAARLLEDAESELARAQQEVVSLSVRQMAEGDQLRSDAAEEAEALVDAARQEAARLVQDAEMRAEENLTEAKRFSKERVEQLLLRLEELRAYERRLVIRATALDNTLEAVKPGGTIQGGESMEWAVILKQLRGAARKEPRTHGEVPPP